MRLINLFFLISCTAYLHGQSSIRFYGGGVNAPDADRIKIPIDDVNNSDPGPPVDVGDEDFTIEFWMKGDSSNNNSTAVSCGFNLN